MRIETTDFVAGARAARGLVVVIDVFRAFSLAAHAFARGAQAIFPVAAIEDALRLKREHPEWLLLGERHARPLPGFDCGNSPIELQRFERERLAGAAVTHDSRTVRERLRAAASAVKFFDPSSDWAPESDFELCTRLDAFDFVLRLEAGESGPCLRRVDVPRVSDREDPA